MVAAVWGAPTWGHVVSSDLAHWQQLPAALQPDTVYDNNGVFSGSATIVSGTPILLYTGLVFLSSNACHVIGGATTHVKYMLTSVWMYVVFIQLTLCAERNCMLCLCPLSPVRGSRGFLVAVQGVYTVNIEWYCAWCCSLSCLEIGSQAFKGSVESDSLAA